VDNDSNILIAGETGIDQVSTGSIVDGSEGFLVKVKLKDPKTVQVKKWQQFKQRRNCATNIFESEGKKYLMLIENAPLTHDTDQSSFLSLLPVEESLFKAEILE